MGETKFSWIQAYEEIATTLLAYEERQDELCEIVEMIIGERYEQMDPFTFFSMFNGKRKNYDKRTEAVTTIIDQFGLDVSAPTDFDGIPVTNPQRWRYWDGKPDTIRHNWQLFRAVVEYADGEDVRTELIRLFNVVHAQGNIGDANLTMALFWVRPHAYIPVDNNTRTYLRNHHGIVAPSPLKGDDYLEMCNSIKKELIVDSNLYDDFPTLSDAAFIEAERIGVEKKAEENALGDADVETVHYWLYAPGEGACMWDDFYEKGIMALGWHETGDLRSYANKEEIKEALRERRNPDAPYLHPGLMLWQFANELKPGDIIFAKKGRSEIVGRGVVVGEYVYDVLGEHYPHIREVKWTHKGNWYNDGKFAVKTLTDVTDYPDFVAKVSSFFEDDVEDEAEREPAVNYPEYNEEMFLAEVFMDEEKYTTLVGVLRSKKNVILQGAPGVGKTFAAKRLAYSMMGVKDPERVMMVQFHQSYSYEDFIEGFRPSAEGFELVKGAFYTFCKKATEDEDNDYFFIIDEINRGNLSKIFGELFMLIENDKRGPKNKLQLLYSRELFHVPSNVYLIGMMNTADRSLAMLDYALRRRFAFFDLRPGFGTDGFISYRDGLASTKLNELLACIVRLNDDISKDDTLGEGFCIGHSYFCGMKPEDVTDAKLSAIVEYELVPMLREYWFDEPSKVREWSESLRRSVK